MFMRVNVIYQKIEVLFSQIGISKPSAKKINT